MERKIVGDDGEYSTDREWLCLCSCARCGPDEEHDCDTAACNSGWYVPKVPDRGADQDLPSST